MFSASLKGWINMLPKTQLSLMQRWQLWFGVTLFLLSLLAVGVHTLTTTKAHAATGLINIYNYTGALGKTVIHSVQVSYTLSGTTKIITYCSTNNPITATPLPTGTFVQLVAATDAKCANLIENTPGYATQRLQLSNLDQLSSCQVMFFSASNFLSPPAAFGCGLSNAG
jgi:hypothetical protein